MEEKEEGGTAVEWTWRFICEINEPSLNVAFAGRDVSRILMAQDNTGTANNFIIDCKADMRAVGLLHCLVLISGNVYK